MTKTQEKIFTAYAELINRLGPNPSVAQICALAKISNGSFFHAFKNREALTIAFYRYGKNHLLPHLRFDANLPAREVMRELWRSYEEWGRANYWLHNAILCLKGSGEISDTLAHETTEKFRPVYDWIANEQAKGTIISIDADLLFDWSVHAIEFLLKQPENERLSEKMFNIFWNGIIGE